MDDDVVGVGERIYRLKWRLSGLEKGEMWFCVG